MNQVVFRNTAPTLECATQLGTSGLDSLDTFGELLRHLRRRARLTQRDFGIAVGYSEAHIARLERNERRPELATIRTRFLDALDLDHEPRLAARLIELAKVAHGAAREQLTTQPGLTNLPVQLTRFIGREREMAELRSMLSDHRLVTLTGAGGVGKTRLAIEVAASVVSEFPDGVWLVELAPLVGPESVPRAVAGVFKLPDDPGRALIETLAEHLKEKRLLLLLDNCEHVIAACAQLAEDLLRACPDARILATSREPLRVSGEAVWQTPPLATPDPDHLPSLEQILSYEAIRLFIEHAENAQPDLKLTSAHTATIAHICHQVDGIPLAIEMVAAQVTAMALQEISERLSDRLVLTVSGRHTALPRHQTLHAALEWSYNLLSEPERMLLARLSAFADGCTADAVKAVCVDESGDLSLLFQLVHKSLVVADTRGEHTRYRLLETVRRFAAEKLNALGETDAIYKRQAAYLIALASHCIQSSRTASCALCGVWDVRS